MTSTNAAGPGPGPPPVTVHRHRAAMLVLALAILGFSVVFGVTTATAEGTLGPHLARYSVTLDRSVTVDFGPLGTLVIDSPLPVLGARVEVREIPSELALLDESSTIDAVSGDLQEYLRFFASPDVAISAAVDALILDAARRTLLATAILSALAIGLVWLPGPARREQLADATRPHLGLVSAGGALAFVLVGAVAVSDTWDSAPQDERTTSAVFDDTPLEGARITGRLAGLIDTYGGYALDIYRENEEFYAEARMATIAAWNRQMAAETVSPSRPTAPTIDALVVSDLHCNVGMAEVIAEVARLADVDLVLNAGDSTVDGTAVEAYCVQAFANAVPDGVDYVISDGNHDSVSTAQQEESAGAIVLNGEVIEVAGLRILGDSDPMQTRIGDGTRLSGDESPSQVGGRLAGVACDDGDVDLLLVHTPAVGTSTLLRGCAPAQVSGHTHVRSDPAQLGRGVRYVSSSSAGAILDQPTIGPLQGTAELTVLRFDAETRRIVDYRVVYVEPSGQVRVGPPLSWPAIASMWGVSPS